MQPIYSDWDNTRKGKAENQKYRSWEAPGLQVTGGRKCAYFVHPLFSEELTQCLALVDIW